MSQTYIPRHLEAELSEALSSARVINLVGPRQVGKTTLVRDLFARGRFVSFDDAGLLAAIEADPLGQIAALRAGLHGAPLIIDEAQRSRALPLAIKALVDTDPRKGQFILTGSSNMFASRHVADSLAGRLRTLTLWPLTAAEIHRAPPSRLIDWALGDAPDPGLLRVPVATRQDVIRLLLEGGFPEIRTLSLRTRQRQYRDNLDLMIDRDVADVMPIRKPDALRRLVDQLAARTANEVSVADLSKALSVRRETVDLYIDVLVRLSVVVRLGAWAAGASNREIKAPKFHLVDSGLLCALRGFRENTFDADADPAALGAVLESYVFNELVRAAPLQDEPAHLFHWRHADGREIDILIEAGRHLIAIEVEASSLINRDSFRHLRWFAREGPGRDRPVTGIVFHLGKEALSFGDRMFALPVAALWSSLNPQFRRNSASTLRSSAGPIQS